MRNWALIFILLFSTVHSAVANKYSEVVILSDSTDNYFPLAKEIAEKEKSVIILDFQEMKQYHPAYVLWVISPENLTEKKLYEFSQFQQESKQVIFTGIISGRTIKDARYLWENRNHRPKNNYVILNGTNESNNVKPKILKISGAKCDTLNLEKSNVQNVISEADYIQVSLHGAARSWFNEKSQFQIRTDELPSLQKCVIQSHACNNFRPWDSQSIALECINKGAIAFSGFVYSPISGSKIGEYEGLNFRYTWSDFPIGIIVQLQNRAASRSYARFPHYFLLGDSKLSFNTDAPYKIVQDITTGDKRTIKLIDAKLGFLPVKISGGESYDYIIIPNYLKFSTDNLFFNKNIECINANGDKYLLFNNTSNEVILELHRKAPLIQKVASVISGFIKTTIVSHQYSGFNVIAGILLFVLIVFKWGKRKIDRQILLRSIIVTIFALVLIATVYLIFWNNIDTTSKQIKFNLIAFIFDSVLLFSGFLFCFNAKSVFWKAVASLLPSLSNILFAIMAAIGPFIGYLVTGIYKIDIMKPFYPEYLMLIETILVSVLLLATTMLVEKHNSWFTFIGNHITHGKLAKLEGGNKEPGGGAALRVKQSQI